VREVEEHEKAGVAHSVGALRSRHEDIVASPARAAIRDRSQFGAANYGSSR